MKNLGGLLKQAQEMQAKMAEMQEELARREVEGVAGGGAVRVVLTVKGEMRRLSVDPALLVPAEREILEDLVVAAHNDAKAKADAVAQEEMQKMTAGLPLPPGFKMPF